MKRLDDELPLIESGEVRVMVIHHAITDANTPMVNGSMPFPRRRPKPRRWLEIDAPSLRALEHTLVNHTIRVVMTGHLHVPRLTEMTASNDVVTLNVLEARCGTTTQQDSLPLGMPATVPAHRALPPNSLIVHQLLSRDGQLVWRSDVHWRAPSRGFVSTNNHISKLLPADLTRELNL